jgi:hypothetical protein
MCHSAYTGLQFFWTRKPPAKIKISSVPHATFKSNVMVVAFLNSMDFAKKKQKVFAMATKLSSEYVGFFFAGRVCSYYFKKKRCLILMSNDRNRHHWKNIHVTYLAVTAIFMPFWQCPGMPQTKKDTPRARVTRSFPELQTVELRGTSHMLYCATVFTCTTLCTPCL